MKQERVILSFIMVLIGLLVAGSVFYFYQSNNKNSPQIINAKLSPTPTPSSNNKVYLKIISPSDESVVKNKNLVVSGETNPKTTVIILTSNDQQVLNSDENGKFKAEVSLGNDQNLITVIAVSQSGESKKIQTTVTYSTSNF